MFKDKLKAQEKIKKVLDDECPERAINPDPHTGSRNCGKTVWRKWTDGSDYPGRLECWCCHKHDSLAAQIAEIEE